MQRLWLQSMTPQSIREGFARLRSDDDMLPLADAARCRSEADWLVGINGTRAMTAFNSKGGGFFLTTVGRVQTPTLSIVVEREEEDSPFRAARLLGGQWPTSSARGGFYEGRWFDPKFQARRIRSRENASRGSWSLAAAESVVAACRDKPGIVTEESKPSTQMSPPAVRPHEPAARGQRRFGFSAKNNTGAGPGALRAHKVLTYPRTDSRALPEDYLDAVKGTLDMLQESDNYLPFAKQELDKGWVKPNKRIFDNSKISDHFAIIPTLQAPEEPLRA